MDILSEVGSVKHVMLSFLPRRHRDTEEVSPFFLRASVVNM